NQISFSMIDASCRSSLIPYTTLFRSEADNPLNGIALSVRGGALSVADGTGVNRGILFSGGHIISVGPSSGDFTIYGDRSGGKSPDRKSTRLNSSHVKISYAVFCLKKK